MSPPGDRARAVRRDSAAGTAADGSRPPIEAEELARGVLSGEKPQIIGLFNLIEDRRPAPARRAAACLDALFAASIERGHTVGLTGPPGVGKSSLLGRLLKLLRQQGRRVGVIAVDPSSRLSQGALLGDRLRLDHEASDAGVFVRSMANRGEFGGVAEHTFAGVVLLRSAFDVAVVETVGVGQTEADVAALVDTTVLVLQPGAGDVIQFIKAGIMEEPDVIVVNKADLGEAARRTLHDLRAALACLPDEGPDLLLASARTGQGLEELAETLDRRQAELRQTDRLLQLRREQAAGWIVRRVQAEYGRHGIQALGGAEAIGRRLGAGPAPYAVLKTLLAELETQIP